MRKDDEESEDDFGVLFNSMGEADVLRVLRIICFLWLLVGVFFIDDFIIIGVWTVEFNAVMLLY